MHPLITHQIARARIDDLQRDAQRQAQAREAREAARARRPEPAHRQPQRRSVLARRVIALLGARP